MSFIWVVFSIFVPAIFSFSFADLEERYFDLFNVGGEWLKVLGFAPTLMKMFLFIIT